MDKILFNEPVGIYIGNNCNLSCEQCLTFSNFNFKKWFRWDSFQDYYNMNIKESIIKLFPRKSKTKLG